jgi:tRNA (guanine37-N1)-methyltransferase
MMAAMPTSDAPPPPIDDIEVRRAEQEDAAEILVLQRCCWVAEAIANDTLDIPALHETLDDVRQWLDEWTTWCVRRRGRLVGGVRAHRDGDAWEIGRLMVAPDLSGQGLGRWLLARVEADAPADVKVIYLFTGAKSNRNIAIYERAGFRRIEGDAPPGAVGLAKPRQIGG